MGRRSKLKKQRKAIRERLSAAGDNVQSGLARVRDAILTPFILMMTCLRSNKIHPEPAMDIDECPTDQPFAATTDATETDIPVQETSSESDSGDSSDWGSSSDEEDNENELPVTEDNSKKEESMTELESILKLPTPANSSTRIEIDSKPLNIKYSGNDIRPMDPFMLCSNQRKLSTDELLDQLANEGLINACTNAKNDGIAFYVPAAEDTYVSVPKLPPRIRDLQVRTQDRPQTPCSDISYTLDEKMRLAECIREEALCDKKTKAKKGYERQSKVVDSKEKQDNIKKFRSAAQLENKMTSHKARVEERTEARKWKLAEDDSLYVGKVSVGKQAKEQRQQNKDLAKEDAKMRELCRDNHPLRRD